MWPYDVYLRQNLILTSSVCLCIVHQNILRFPQAAYTLLLLYLFQDSSIAVGSRDSEHSSSMPEGSTGSSRYRGGG